ncbi:MAG TPA: hypothetical protein VJ820_01490, partial [Propionibacteriaceae bacterium]|nr:hypothetical protein [Propionibacteriaceae bacterium]
RSVVDVIRQNELDTGVDAVGFDVQGHGLSPGEVKVIGLGAETRSAFKPDSNATPAVTRD